MTTVYLPSERTVEVWHADRPTFTEEAPEFPGAFTRVASLVFTHPQLPDTDTLLDTVYRLTNHRELPWNGSVMQCFALSSDGVQFTHAHPSARSTSVGDLIRTPDGQVWIVANIGFLPLHQGAA